MASNLRCAASLYKTLPWTTGSESLRMLVTRQQLTHLSKLIQLIGKFWQGFLFESELVLEVPPTVSQYFVSFSSVLIVHNTTLDVSPLHMEYLDALQLSLCNLSQPVKLQWINVAELPNDDAQPDALEWEILCAVNDSVTEVGLIDPKFGFKICNYFSTICRVLLLCCLRQSISFMLATLPRAMPMWD